MTPYSLPTTQALSPVCAPNPSQGFLRKVVLSTPALKDRYAAVQRERAEAEGDDMDVSA